MDTYILYAFAAVALAVSFLRDVGKSKRALMKGLKAFEGVLPQFLVILLLVAAALAILDQGTISRLLGRGSGALGVVSASVVGAVVFVPGFVAFPLAAALLAEGAGAMQVAAFVSSLMMVGVTSLPLEARYMGRKAALARNGLSFLLSFVVAAVVGWAARV